jgi:hypothetical protein
LEGSAVAGKTEGYRVALQALPGLDAWEEFLLAESALPGPRANLELLAAVVEEASAETLLALLERAPAGGQEGEPDPRREFLAACGAAGLGRLLAEGEHGYLLRLRELAGDPRWRVREGVAMALQRWGEADPDGLLAEAGEWSRGSRWEQRAAVAGLCEPRLLATSRFIRGTLSVLDALTAGLVGAADRRDEAFRVLRQALGYGWSVVAVADTAAVLPLLERWLQSSDDDVRWVMKQNLAKARLRRAAPDWVAAWRSHVAAPASPPVVPGDLG